MKTYLLFIIALLLSCLIFGQNDTLRYDFSNEKRKVILRNATEDEALKFFEERNEQVIYKAWFTEGKIIECKWYRKENFTYKLI